MPAAHWAHLPRAEATADVATGCSPPMPGSAAISDPRPPAAALGSSRERAPSGHPQTRSPQALRLHRVDPAPGLALAAVTLATLRPLALAEQFPPCGRGLSQSHTTPRVGSGSPLLP